MSTQSPRFLELDLPVIHRDFFRIALDNPLSCSEGVLISHYREESLCRGDYRCRVLWESTCWSGYVPIFDCTLVNL